MPITTTYLLCFAHNPVGRSRHYLGKTQNLKLRLWQHHKRNTTPLMRELRRRQGTFNLARTWPQDVERELKRQKNAPRLCPICNPGKNPGLEIAALRHKPCTTPTPAAIAELRQRLERAS